MKHVSDIRLRALEPEDLELIYRIENDPTFWRWGSTTVPYSRYTLRQYLQTAANDLYADQQVRLVIEGHAAEDATTMTASSKSLPYDQTVPRTALGLADLTNFQPQHLRAEISLAILPEFQGCHVGEVAVQQLISYARSLGLHQLYALIATTNHPACRLFHRIGFEADAILKEWLFYDGRWTDVQVFRHML